MQYLFLLYANEGGWQELTGGSWSFLGQIRA